MKTAGKYEEQSHKAGVMAPILYCRCSNCVCKATVLLTDTIKINGTSQEKEDVGDVEKVSVMIEEYVEHNESRKENVEMRGGGGEVEVEVEGGTGAQPPLESLFSLILLLVILICKSGRDWNNIVLSNIFTCSQSEDLQERHQDSHEGQDLNLQTEQGGGRGGAWLHLFCPEDRGEEN